MSRRIALWACLLFLLPPVPKGLAAGDPDSMAVRFARGRRVRKRGSLKALRGHRVPVAGRQELTIEELANGLFRQHRALDAELIGSDRGLFGATESSGEVVETDDATLITKRTRFTVADPDKLRRRSGQFRRFRRRKARGSWTLADLGPEGKKAFEAFKARLKKRGADHPLRKAAALGDDALVDAVLAGMGDMEVATTVVIPKRALARSASGRLKVPGSRPDGTFDYAATREVATRASALSSGSGNSNREVEAKRSSEVTETITGGKIRHTARFLAGFTKEDSFVWQRKWTFPSGHLIVKFKPWYEFGLRIPLEVKGTIAPATIVHKGPEDKPVEYEVSLKARTLDAGSSFYEEVGLEKSQVNGGDEFVLGAGFEVVIDLKAGWVIKKKWTLPENARFDFGSDFVPPFGDCAMGCGFDIWIPADVTGTKLSLLGIVTGSARLGFKVTGDGEIRADFEALSGGDTIKSWRPGSKRSPKRKHTLVFRGPEDEERVLAEAVENKIKGLTRHYGYVVSEPRYNWNVDLVPGVRADIHVKAKPFLNDDFPIGPLWLTSLKIDLGLLKLGRHAGTTRRHKVRLGDKTWRKRRE